MQSLNEKIDYSLELIERALSEHDNPVVGCSFGKDSMAVLHLVRRVRPDITAVFINTGVEFPDTVRFARRMTDEWDIPLTVARPEGTFWQVVDQFGFPLRTRGAGSTKKMGEKPDPEVQRRLRQEAKAAEKCCETLKKKPMKKLIKENGYDLLFDGMTAFENQLRRMISYIYGDYHYVKSWGLTKCHPIQNWKLSDVWDYHKLESIPWNPLYDKKTKSYQVRTGCWCCTIAVNGRKLKFLREHYPRMWRVLLEKKGLAEVLIAKKLDISADDIDGRVVDDYLENYPCFFDDMKAPPIEAR